MRIFQALARPKIRWLWGGQVFSAVGDEVYNIALVWYAASLLGTNAGYLSAIQAASIVVFSLIGGIWVDHRDHRKVMIATDLIRGVAVLSLPLFAVFAPLNLWVLLAVAIVVSSLSAFFQPAMNAFLTHLIREPDLLKLTSGLMETTSRIARVIGPGLIGVLSRFVPLVHYFTIDAMSFFASAASLWRVRTEPTHHEEATAGLGLKANLLAGHHLVLSRSVVAYTVFSGAIAAAAWMFIFPLGLTLFLRDRLSTDVGALGFLVSGYGIGNISSNLALTYFRFHRPERWMFAGRVIAGCGFVILSQCTTLGQMMAASAIAAIGGPMTDLGFVILVQKYFRGREIARVFRYTMAISYAALLVVYLMSPSLFAHFSVQGVLLANAIVIVFTGLMGFAVKTA